MAGFHDAPKFFGENLPKRTIIGKDIKTIVEKTIVHIRERSKDFYKKSIEKELLEKGEATVDVHAGMGVYLFCKIIK